MRFLPNYLKREIKKFIYSGNTPQVKINYRFQVTGGVSGRFGTIQGGSVESPTLRRSCYVVPLAQASRRLEEVGVFNEGSQAFYFDRDDSTLKFDEWDKVIITYQKVEYFVDPVKMKKVEGITVPLAESSMAQLLIGEINL